MSNALFFSEELFADAIIALAQRSDIFYSLGSIFADYGYELYLVGGSIRDALIGRFNKFSDLDFTTNAHPEHMLKFLKPWADTLWDTGIEFGTVSLSKKGCRPIEITTFRTDNYDQISRNPNVNFGNSLIEDLVRRDFTINSIAAKILPNVPNNINELIDPLGGLEDIKNKIIDTPSMPESSFNDDPLRMLRAARLVSQLGFEVSKSVFKAISKMSLELRRVNTERISTELDKLLLGVNPVGGVNLTTQTGLSKTILPELGKMQMETDEHYQHKDIYWHSLTVLHQAIKLENEGPDLILRWATLLHDIGKPITRKQESSGVVSFHHHEVVGSKMVQKRMKVLKYSKQFIADVSRLVYLHLRFHGFVDIKGNSNWTDSAVRRYVVDAGHLLNKLHKLVRADCTTRNKYRANKLQTNYNKLEKRITDLTIKENLERVRPDLNGSEIIKILKITAGPQVGKAWKYLKEIRLEKGLLSYKEASDILFKWQKSDKLK